MFPLYIILIYKGLSYMGSITIHLHVFFSIYYLNNILPISSNNIFQSFGQFVGSIPKEQRRLRINKADI